MKLKPVVASYSGLSYQKVMSTLTNDYLDVIAHFILDQQSIEEVEPKIIQEFCLMHVLKKENENVKLNTTVFLESDMKQILKLSSEMGAELAHLLCDVGHKLNQTSPEIKNFLGGVVGVSQGASQFLKQSNLLIDWKNYEGKYARCKVDFDEDCEFYQNISPDLQIKTVLKGDRYTAVFIGPKGRNYQEIMYHSVSKENVSYINEVLKYLTDSYALLLEGKLESESLEKSAKQFDLYNIDKPKTLVVNEVIIREYLPVIKNIIKATCRYYLDRINVIRDCLENTTSGKFGVSVENMMMHFWRYCRKEFAKALYKNGFFTDDVQEKGSITVFYDHRITEINELF